MEQPLRSPLVVAAALLGVSVVLGTAVVAKTLYSVKTLGNVISVTGSAEKLITSDTVKWTTSFSRNAGSDELKDASAGMKQDLAAIRAGFTSNGVTDAEVTVQPLTITQLCDNPNNVTYDKSGERTCGGAGLSGYSLQQTVLVESARVQEVTKLAQELPGAMINQNILFTSQSVEYFYRKLADLKIEMLGTATKDAINRADAIAKNTDASIGKVQSASMGVFQVTAPNSTDVSDYGEYDTDTIEKKVTAVVRASFQLK